MKRQCQLAFITTVEDKLRYKMAASSAKMSMAAWIRKTLLEKAEEQMKNENYGGLASGESEIRGNVQDQSSDVQRGETQSEVHVQKNDSP